MKQILEAVFRNDPQEVAVLLDQGSDVNVQDEDGRTCLIHAAIDGREEVARLLLERGASPDHQDDSGQSALHFAAQEHHVSVARLLLERGASVDPKDSNGNTPLSNAVFYSRGRGEMIALLLDHGADPSLKNNHGVSPAELARSIDNYDVARFFE